jgi:hypothetical protein
MSAPIAASSVLPANKQALPACCVAAAAQTNCKSISASNKTEAQRAVHMNKQIANQFRQAIKQKRSGQST